MRTAFRRELKKIKDSKKTGSGTDEVYTPTLWYFEHLSFLSEDEVGRSGISTLKENVDDFSQDESTDIIEVNIFLYFIIQNLKKEKSVS